MQAVRDERLGAVDDVVVAVAHGGGRDAAEIRAGARLGHRDRAHELAAHERAAPRPAAARPCRSRARSASRSRARPCRSTRSRRAGAPRRRRTRSRSRPRARRARSGTSVPSSPASPALRQSSASTYPRACQALVVGQDLALDPGPRGLAEQLVLVARPGRAGPQGARRGHARDHRTAGRQMTLAACAIWPTRRVHQRRCRSAARTRTCTCRTSRSPTSCSATPPRAATGRRSSMPSAVRC